MIGLFSFDGPLYKDADGVYCNVTLTNEMFNRYFSVVDKLYVVVRTFKSDKTYHELNMKPLITDNMEVIEVNNLNSLTGMTIEKKKLQDKISSIVQKADLFFARMPSQTSNVVLEITRKFGKPYLVEVGGCAWDSFWNHGMLGKLIAPYMYFNARRNISKAEFAVYVTKKFLQRRYPNSNRMTNCSNVYLHRLDNNILKERLDKIDKMDCSRPVFGQAVNSIDVKYKGEHLILRAMKSLKEKGIMVEFQVVGPGTGEFLKSEAVKYGVIDQLKIVGTLKKEEMENWYKSIDIYAQPSKQEGLPRSVIEAMSTGCPAIGSRIAGIPELLDRECLFNPNSNAQIIDVILRLLNKNVMFNQANRNYETAQEYDISKIEARRQKIFEEYRSFVSIEKNE